MISKMFGSEERMLLLFSVIVTLIKLLDGMFMKITRKAIPWFLRVRSDSSILYQNLGFTLLLLAQNYRQLKNSKTGYSPRYSHLSANKANTNCLIVPGIK